MNKSAFFVNFYVVRLGLSFFWQMKRKLRKLYLNSPIIRSLTLWVRIKTCMKLDQINLNIKNVTNFFNIRLVGVTWCARSFDVFEYNCMQTDYSPKLLVPCSLPKPLNKSQHHTSTIRRGLGYLSWVLGTQLLITATS